MGANRLIHEPSPYLRLHAHNPVDWYPWGEEAFARARAENKPIFLSIGYYTCHWCHVMERESFQSEAIAALLNRDFISIKVDREERPDVDRLYMTFVQATTGSGGWPLSAFLTPELKPFFGGTYFPITGTPGQPAFGNLLQTIATGWQNQRDRIEESAAALCTTLQQQISAAAASTPAAAGTLTPASRDATWRQLMMQLYAAYDQAQGGFGGAPKFPRPATLEFLARVAAQSEAEAGARQAALRMLLGTLGAMARGGIRDHLSGGFHRYSTDAHWHVPHFEKMLYDQAQLVRSYLAAWQLTGEGAWAGVARETADFMLAEMRAPGGAFFSALDADSDDPPGRVPAGRGGAAEGAYYVWTSAEFDAALAGAGPPAAPAAETLRQLARRAYGVETNGNVPPAQDPHGELTGRNVLYAARPEASLMEEFGLDAAAVRAVLALARQRLLEARRGRPRPPLDDKILTAWNGLGIAALARAGATLGEARYLQAARTAAQWIEANLYDAASATLFRRYRDGARAIAGFTDDYAFLIDGLLELWEAEADPRWLAWAQRLQQRQDEQFAAPGGGYYSAAPDAHLWMRLREDYDGAEPSPNSVAAFNLFRLSHWLDDAGLRQRGVTVIEAFGPRLQALPEALPLLAAALEPATRPPALVLITGPAGFDDLGQDVAPGSAAAQARALWRQAQQMYRPRHAVLAAAGAERMRALAEASPRLAESFTFDDASAPAAYVCEGYHCLPPISDAAELARHLATH